MQDAPIINRTPKESVRSPEEEWRALAAGLATRDPTKRLKIARTLAGAGPAIVPILLEVLETADGTHREAIIGTLRMMGHSARAALERLQEDEAAGKLVREALADIRRRWSFDGERLLTLGVFCTLGVFVLLTVISEAGSWMQLWQQLQGPALAVALAWGFLGCVGGAFLGWGLGAGWLAKKGAKFFGTAGACAGAILGRWIGLMLEPLIKALGG